jgi:hypothetical protein
VTPVFVELSELIAVFAIVVDDNPAAPEPLQCYLMPEQGIHYLFVRIWMYLIELLLPIDFGLRRCAR